MRQKYLVFDKNKITTDTIKIALELKKNLPEGIYEVSLTNTNPNLVPTGNDKKFLEWICAKYLKLSYEDGYPLLKQAYKQQYHIEDMVKLCKYCNKPFQYTRKTKEFCSHKCQVRFSRWGEKDTNAVTLTAASPSKDNLEISISGTLPLTENLSVTKNGKNYKNKKCGLGE